LSRGARPFLGECLEPGEYEMDLRGVAREVSL